MKFHIEDIVAYAKQGYPYLSIYRNFPEWTSPLIDYPDEWFHVLVGEAPRVGKKHGHVYMSRAGFQAFEPDLYAAFQQSNNPTCPTWDDYKAKCEQHFVNVEKARQKLIKKHQKIIDELNNFNV
jgi:hypothetical protein